MYHTLLSLRPGWVRDTSVILGFAQQAQVLQGCNLFHDNSFTLAVLDEMTKRVYGSSRMIRQLMERLVEKTITTVYHSGYKHEGEIQ